MPTDYPGADVAATQHSAYPDIRPVDLAAPACGGLCARARRREGASGGTSRRPTPPVGRIEATATTPWFGFRDDVVIRVTPTEGGSRVDVRSLSRVGRGDLGTNAKRVRAFLAKLAS